ncbi:hypothetical protein [Rhodococcus koreensis]|uniref:hypothetical protein n=1 Tax=Rhodococcus koreensis TaxID=99653 RepID=UPI0019808711|nr:hypothetical protein [Rhodococcus koreensis]QSE84762.1 hypothetical protein JWS14_39500 [Rhodococcus koreensis]
MNTTVKRGSRLLAAIVVAATLAALAAGAASADATMTAVGGPGKVTVTAKGDNTARDCDVGVLDQSKRSIASQEASLAPNKTHTVTLTSLPAGSSYTVVMRCGGQKETGVEGVAVRPAPDPH